MPARFALAATLAMSACLTIGLGAPRADYVSLKTGGEIRGEVLDDGKKSHREVVTIRSLSGATILVVHDEIDSVVRRRPIVEDYETRRRSIPDTATAHVELAEWCRQKSLPKEREGELRRVVELDPENTPAHRALGHIRHQGKWATHDEVMTGRGFVKYKGKYVLPQELELILQDERISDSEKGWFRRVKLWHGWLDSGHSERQTAALAELQAIKEPDAVSALSRSFKAVADEEQRMLYVRVLAKIEGDKPLNPLIMQSLWDESSAIREASIKGVRHKDVDKALPAYVRALKNSLNLIVNRAGTALGELGNDGVIPPLIDALVTRHAYVILVPETSTSFRTDGTMTGPGEPVLPPNVELMLAAGQLPYGVQVQTPAPPRMKEVPVEKDEENPAVLGALTQLTGENFGYDEPAWRKWYNAQHNLKHFPANSRRQKPRP